MTLTFAEYRERWSLLPSNVVLEMFYGLPERERAEAWAELAERCELRTESELLYEQRQVAPWCPECHDRRIDHEPGDCPKYKMPEKGSPSSRSTDSSRVEFDHIDVLKTVPASVYVTAFTGASVPASGRILCPLHESRNPSVFKCYGARWTCFAGCGQGADIYDLASALTGIEARGAGFIELRRWIAAALLGGGLRA